MSQLRIDNLQVSYDKKMVVKNINLAVDTGEIVGLFGPSGCGKTTVLKAISGLLNHAEGDVRIGNDLVSDLPTESRNIGLIFQDYALFPHLTVAENIAFGLFKMTPPEQTARVSALLELIEMQELANQYPHQLSGGQQQRVAIVRALATDPKVMLFDESFSNLDPQFRFELIHEMRSLLKAQNTTAIFVTHNQDEAFAFCDRIAVMNDGEIAQIDTPIDLFLYPASRFVAEFLGQGIWLPATIISNCKLQSDWGELPYDGLQELDGRQGEEVDVYLRPHQIGLNENESGQFEITSERFVGEFYQAEVVWNHNVLKIRTHDSYLNKRVDIRIKQPVSKVFPRTN